MSGQCILLRYRGSVITRQSSRVPVHPAFCRNTAKSRFNITGHHGPLNYNRVLWYRVYPTCSHYHQVTYNNCDTQINTLNQSNMICVLPTQTPTLQLCTAFHSSVINLKISLNANFPLRQLHSNSRLLKESNVEQAVKTLKKQKEQDLEKQVAVGATPTIGTVVPKAGNPPLGERIMKELKHYYHGFKLLFYDIMVASKMCVAILRGQSLTRREKKQFVRTVADLFRLVPFLVIVIVPFLELALPIILKFFPNMLPSTFADKDKEKEKLQKKLKVKLEMAKFLQDTVMNMAVERKGAKGERVGEFAAFMDRIRTSGGMVTNEEILKYSKLFEDEITLDNMTYPQLRALCKLLDIPVVDVSIHLLRFQIQLKLRQLEADDKLIQKEGIDSLSKSELKEACRARGMQCMGVPQDRLKVQLGQWLDLHLNQEIPTSLLLLSRALFMPEKLDTAVTLKQILTKLPSSATEEAKVKYAETSGDRVDNKAKLQVIKHEQEIIDSEKEEIRRAQEQARAEDGETKKQELHRAVRENLADKDPKPVQIHSKDLGDVKEIFQTFVETRAEIQPTEKELKMLKEDLSDYKDSAEQLKAVVTAQDGRPVQQVTESKAARILGKKVNTMIGQIDKIVDGMNNERSRMTQAIEKMEGKMSNELKEDERQKIIDRLTVQRRDLVSITDLMNQLQTVTDETKVEKIVQVLDNDRDGKIDVHVALKVIELIGMENVKLSRDQVASIIDLIHKEEQVLQQEKEERLKCKCTIDSK